MRINKQSDYQPRFTALGVISSPQKISNAMEIALAKKGEQITEGFFSVTTHDALARLKGCKCLFMKVLDDTPLGKFLKTKGIKIEPGQDAFCLITGKTKERLLTNLEAELTADDFYESTMRCDSCTEQEIAAEMNDFLAQRPAKMIERVFNMEPTIKTFNIDNPFQVNQAVEEISR